MNIYFSRFVAVMALFSFGGCAAMKVAMARNKRNQAASELPYMMDGNQAGELPEPGAVEVDRETWNELVKNASAGTLCQKGKTPNAEWLKEIQDAIGGADLYQDIEATEIKSLPFSNDGDVESVALECSAEKVVLGVNGEAISADWIATFLGELEMYKNQLAIHMLAVSHETGDALWVYMMYNRGNGQVSSKASSATNIKKYLAPVYSNLYTLVVGLAPGSPEFMFVEQGKKEEGLYLYFDMNNADEPKVGRFSVAAGN